MGISATKLDSDQPDSDNEEQEIETIDNYEVNNIEVASDKNQYAFTKLPEIIGTGQAYDISIITVFQSPRETEKIETKSKICTERFISKPLPPTQLGLGRKDKPLNISWHRSVTPNVNAYKIKWKPIIDDPSVVTIKSEEYTIDIDSEDEVIDFSFPKNLIVNNTGYKVNVYAIAESGGLVSESKELHEKFLFKKDPFEVSVYNETATE